MITKRDIKLFIENHFNEDDISKKEKRLSVHRGYFYYMCYKYSTDIINSSELRIFMKVSQHGTVINALDRTRDYLEVDKRAKLEYGCLENEFLKIYEVPEIIKEVYAFKDGNRKLINLQNKYNKLLYKNQNLKAKILKLKNKTHENNLEDSNA